MWAAVVCAAAGFALFQWFGNATRGYVDTASAFWWWISQWLDPRADAEHGWLILALSGWLFVRNLRASGNAGRVASSGAIKRVSDHLPAAESASRRTAVAVLAMLLALGLHAIGFVAQQTRVSIVAWLLFTWGVLRLGGGRRWSDAAKFPLGFLVFAIPLNVLDSVGFWLRLWVVDAADAMARWSGIAVVRSGTQLFSAEGKFQYDVAAACSGVRSLQALAALSLLIGYLNFRSWWRRALVLALCLPLTYLGNVVRIGAILFAAEAGGQIWGERAHDAMGFGVFVIVLGGVLLAVRVFQKVAPENCHTLYDTRIETVLGDKDRAEVKEKARGRDGSGSGGGVWAAAGGVAVAVLGTAIWLSEVEASPARGAAGVRLAEDGVDPVELPAFVGTDWIGRRAEVSAVEREILPADTGFSRRNYVSLAGGAHTVFVSIVLSGRDRTSIHRPELCLVAQGWTIREQTRYSFSLGKSVVVPASLLQTERVDPGSGRRIPAMVAYWFVSSDRVVATHWARFFHDAWNRLRGRADRWAYVLVQADAGDGTEAALERMRAVLEETVPAFQVGQSGGA